MEKITPGRNGLPSRKKEYTPEEKALIVAAAAEAGTQVVADAYKLDWHYIASWKKYYGEVSDPDMSKKKNKNQNKNQQKLDAAKKKMITTRGGTVNTAALIIQSCQVRKLTLKTSRLNSKHLVQLNVLIFVLMRAKLTGFAEKNMARLIYGESLNFQER